MIDAEKPNLDSTGQHYMIDKDLIKFIVNEAMLLPTDVVLEIGYGHGELTKEIAKKCKVIAVDIHDAASGERLNHKNITTVKGNILESFEKIFGKYGFNKIISNIPYNISEPLMKKIFQIDVEMVLLTMGKKFSEILTAEDNRISIIANHLYDIEIMRIVSPKSFHPMPRVDSAVVMMRQKDIDSVPKTSAIYKELVLMDDKKLKNCFEKILADMTKKQVKELTKDKLFEKKLYQLSNEEFMKLDEFVNGLE
jgi:16S rRNA A1518/A1519 N6-dimethyltransferase RsmA/KsgA/DIM1 with predicted DNA glycosylase/AP lyase activity